MLSSHDHPFARLHITGNPFSMATSQEHFFHTPATRTILEELAHGILTRKGFLALMGEVGVGKTSLALQLFSRLESEPVDFAWVFTTMFTKEDLFRAIAEDFGLHPDPGWTLLDHQRALQEFFLARYQEGRICVIAVDEAHNLTFDSLEALRLLGNFEFGGHKLVQVLLIAQPELAERLTEPCLRQLKSRIAISRTLPELSRQELVDYTHFKLATAGSQLRLTPWGARRLWRGCRGNVRLANLILERALYACMAQDATALDGRVLGAALAEVRRERGAADTFSWTWAVAAMLGLSMALAFVPLWEVDGKRLSAAAVLWEVLRPNASTQGAQP
jgi:general secretion pathway protein A